MTLKLPIDPIGAVFDVDETILDNGHQTLGVGFHEKLRLQAVHEIAYEQGINELKDLTLEDSTVAFRTAFQHTFTASLWNMFCMAGIRKNPTQINEADALLVKVTERKNDLYLEALKNEIIPIENAEKLIKLMYELTDGLVAIASTARRIDIDTFLITHALDQYFLPDRIISIENVSSPKPDPESFTLGFRSLGIPEDKRARVVAFEDAPKGVASAKQSGLYTIAITTHFTREELMSSEYPPDMVIDGYQELFI